MSKLNPVEAHTKTCKICQESQEHLLPIFDQMKKVFEGKISAPLVECDDCREDVHGKIFMVHDALWEQISGGKDPCILCAICAEKRLGRRFGVGDFQPIPINAAWIYAVERYR